MVRRNDTKVTRMAEVPFRRPWASAFDLIRTSHPRANRWFPGDFSFTEGEGAA